MIYTIANVTYTLNGSVLEKAIKPSPGQIDLFSGEVYEPPVPRRKKKDNGQMLLFSQQQSDPELIPIASPAPKVKPKKSGGKRRSPKGGGYFTNPATGESKFFAGGKFIPGEFSEPTQTIANTVEARSVRAAMEPDVQDDGRSLEKLFLDADRIGNKYQTDEERSEFNRQLAQENEAIEKLIDQQFPEESTPEIQDYSGTSPGQPAPEKARLTPRVAPKIADPTSRDAIAARMDRLKKRKVDNRPKDRPSVEEQIKSIPDSVLTNVKVQINSIKSWNQKVAIARQTDSKFQGGGRYVWEAVNGTQPDFSIELSKLDKFKELAASKDLDGDAILNHLGFEAPVQLLEQERDEAPNISHETPNISSEQLPTNNATSAGEGAIAAEDKKVDYRPKDRPSAEMSIIDTMIDVDYKEARGQKTRSRINRQVRELLAQKRSDFTAEEKELLSKYSGWGGITGGDDASINEYYTRSDVAKFCVDLLYKHGFSGGALLEPSCGAGVFLSHAKRSGVLPVGVEMDETSSMVARALNPHAEVQNAQFERFCLDNPDLQFEGIVGNVPFGTRTVSKDFKAAQYKLDQWKDAADFFVNESLERLKPEGVMALIVPHGVVSGNAHMNLRQELVKKGRVLGVYRLPESAFKHSGTNVVADILVVQKHPDSVINSGADVSDPVFVGGGYFTDRPQNVLGTATTKKRGFQQNAVSVSGEINEQILNAAPTLEPAVEYAIAPKKKELLVVGSTKYVNGRQYRLNENHQWELVDQAEAAAKEANQEDSSVYGTDSIAAAAAQLRDPSTRMLIDPDRLPAFLALAGGVLDGKDRKGLEDAQKAVDGAKSTIDRAKITHAVILANHLKRLQSGKPDSIDRQKALRDLSLYREKYGNPTADKELKALSLQHPALLSLMGAFDESGKISDYFADPDKMKREEKSVKTSAAAMNEAFRSTGGEAVTIAEIKEQAGGNQADSSIAYELLSDPTVGYSNGTFQPLDRLLVGNGYDLIATLGNEADSLPDGDVYRAKLEEQISEIRRRLEPRSLEDMTTPVWAVGSWIPVEAFNAFLKDRGYNGMRFNRENGWEVDIQYKRDAYGRVTSGYATEFEQDVATVMNRGRLSHGSKTKEAKEAVAAIELDLREWLASSDYRFTVEQNYNAAFNGDLPIVHSGEAIEIQGIEQHEGKRLHHYQNSTIRQMAEQGRGIIALGVGLGKTASAIGLGQYLRQNGQAKKPCTVVPKSVLANWVREIKFWGPNLNVMIVGQTQQFWESGEPAWELPGHKFVMKAGNPKRDRDGNYLLYQTGDPGKTQISMTEEEVQKRGNLAFSDDDAATKQRKLQQVAQNSYDLVLMSEPVFQSIALDPEREMEMLDKLTDQHINADSKAAKEKSYKLQEKIETRKRQLLERRGDKTEHTYWEELGIDCLIHDEAHHLKNLFGTQRTGDVAFLSQAQSDRSLDFYYKSQYTRDQNNNQNVFLLTATPTTNNPLEAYNMLQHVCPEEFEKRGIQNVDDFLAMFGSIEEVAVPGVDLEMTKKNGLVGFKNLRDLRHLFNKYCRMQSAKDVGLPIPEERNHDVEVEMTPAQQSVYASLKARAKDLMKEGRDSDREEGDDHIFSVISDMDKAAIDLNYYEATKSPYGESAEIQTDEDARSPKIESCAERVMASRAGNGGKQIVFCDAVQLHEEIKRQLVASGYPEKEIMIVNAQTCSRASDRQKVSQAYNDGRITLVIGNTATMGEGMNFQVGTTDIYHLTTPWTPAAIEQRNGRGVRQGNKLDEVNIHYFGAKRSFDLYRRGVVERKRGWIDELWRGSEDTMVNQNTGGMDMDEIAIMLSDDPEAARKQLESNREFQEQRYREQQKKQSMKQFGQIQTMKLALAKMSPDRRASGAGRELEEKVKQGIAALSRNEHFPYKALLDGDKPAYIGTDGTVLAIGDHVEQQDGSVVRITDINPNSHKMEGVRVVGGTRSPFDYDPDKKESIDFKNVNSGRYFSVKPIAFSDEARTNRMVEGVRSYKNLQLLSSEAIDQNREGLQGQIMENDKYTYVPYEDKDGNVQAGYAKDIPEGGRLLMPQDEGVGDRLIDAWANASLNGEKEWAYSTAIESMQSKPMSYAEKDALRNRVRARVEELKAVGKADADTGSVVQSIADEHDLDIDTKARLKRLVDTNISQNDGQASRDGVRQAVMNAVGDRKTPEEKEAIAAATIQALEPSVKFTTSGKIKTADDVVRSLTEDLSPLLRIVSIPRKNISDVKVLSPADSQIANMFVRNDATPEEIEAKLNEFKGKLDKRYFRTSADAPSESTPATPATPTPAPIAEPAKERHPDPIGAIHAAIAHLENADDDRGAEKNDRGWSGATRDFGSSLARQIASGRELTPNQYRAALTMLNTHRKQVGGDLPTHDDLANVLPESKSDSNGRITLDGDEIVIHTPKTSRAEFQANLDKMRSIPGRSWDGTANRMPISSFLDAVKHFPDYEVDPKLHGDDRIFMEKAKQTEPAGVIKRSDGKLKVSFPYNPKHVATVKEVKHGGLKGKWDGKSKTWEFADNDALLGKLVEAFPDFELRKMLLAGVPYQLRYSGGNLKLVKCSVR